MQQEHQLPLIQRFAALAKDAAHQQIDLVAQYPDGDLLRFDRLTQRRHFLGELWFAHGVRRRHRMMDTLNTVIEEALFNAMMLMGKRSTAHHSPR